MRRLLVPLTALGLLGIVIGCKSTKNTCNSCDCGGPGYSSNAPFNGAYNGGTPPVIVNPAQKMPGATNGAPGKIPDMPPVNPPPKNGEPPAKDLDTSTGSPVKTPERVAPF